MDITIIVPYDKGIADVNCDISAGIRVYKGKLTIEQILKLMEGPNYPERAVLIKRDDNGEVVFVDVTFNNEDGAKPHVVDPNEKYWKGCEGAYFDDEIAGNGRLSYGAYYSKMEEPPK